MSPHDEGFGDFQDGHGHDHDHSHRDSEEDPDQDDWQGGHLWNLENVVLRTVGIDIGSSTSHVLFSRVLLQRRGSELSSRFAIVKREILWESDVLLTPYLTGNRIDAAQLKEFISAAYQAADIDPSAIDSGAVILTGEALKRENAHELAEIFATEGGNFVCATAGHHLEALLAAHGSGAVGLSRAGGSRVLNVDLGGGTSKLTLVDNGKVLGTVALEVGGRLLARSGRTVTRVEDPIRRFAAWAGVEVALGAELSESDEQRLADAEVGALVAAISGRWDEAHAADVLVTELWDVDGDGSPDEIVFSGGVSEYVNGHSVIDYGDLGRLLGMGLKEAAARGELPAPLAMPEHGIRATVIGSSQFSVQLSGNTVDIEAEAILPLRDIPIVVPTVDLSGDIDVREVAAAILAAARVVDHGKGDFALALRWEGDPEHSRLLALTKGVLEGISSLRSTGRRPVVVVIDADIGRTLGRLLREEAGQPTDLICLDGLSLRELDYIDVGQVIRPAGVVPVVVKSLLFAH